MNRWLISQCRPKRSVDLLLRANLGPDDVANRAWRKWLRMRSIEESTWLEVRLLAPLARRMARLDPHSPLRPRLEGLAKLQWTRTQLIIRDCISALDALESVGIKFLLFKGAAHYAEGLASATRRIMGDVDILVLPEAVVAASDRLCETGWSSKGGYSPETLRRRVQIKLGGEDYLKGEFGEIDLHFQVFYFARRDRELDASLWENACPARFAGRPVLVPSPADSIVISIADGVRSGEGDWAMDIAYRIRTCQIEWDRVAYIADRRGLVPFVLSGLTYLRSLGCDIPQSTLDCLRDARPSAGEYLKYWDFWIRGMNAPHTHKLRMGVKWLAHALLPQDRYQYE